MKTYTPEQTAAYKKAQQDKKGSMSQVISGFIDQLIAETDAAKKSASFLQYMEAAAKFHHYSYYNQLLIYTHMPEASRVAGYKTWYKFGRYVKANETGIPIFAPMIYSTADEKADGTPTTTTHMRFKIVYVFDVSQTDGKPLPDIEWNDQTHLSVIHDKLTTYARQTIYP